MTTAAWYVLSAKNPLARWFNTLHWPYTLWHLSYVAIGAALAEQLDWELLGWTTLAFFLGMGVAAHCYDLLQGDPLRLGIKPRYLGIVGALALTGAVAIGLVQISLGNVSVWLLEAVAIGILLVLGYNLEWPGLHGDWQFATAWAVFPFLVGYFVQGIAFHSALIPALAFAFTSAYAQRMLSRRARFLRRNVAGDFAIMTSFSDCLMVDGEAVGKDWVLKPLDLALMWLNGAVVLLALAILLLRL